MELFLTVCVTSVTLGLLYSLFALGLGLVLRTSGQLNLAHGDSLMLATYVGLGTSTAVGLSDVAIRGRGGGRRRHRHPRPPGRLLAGATRGRRAGMAGLGFLPALGVALIVRNVAVQADPEGSSPFPSLFAGGRSTCSATTACRPQGGGCWRPASSSPSRWRSSCGTR